MTGSPALVMVLGACLWLISAPLSTTAEAKAVDVHVLGDSVAGTGSTPIRTRHLVYWMNDQFDWSATDYQRRTPAEVIERRAGNCAELAAVLHLLLDSLGVRTRWAHEINGQSERRPPA